MQRIHRSNIGVLKNTLLKHSPESNYNGVKCNETYLKCVTELEFRKLIKMMNLPISSKII